MTLSLDVFITKTGELLEKERQAEVEESRVLHERTTAKELERQGKALTKLRLASTHSGLYGRTVLVFEPFWPGKDLPAHSFSPGDIAGISQSDGENEEFGSGIVSRVTPLGVSVAFDESTETTHLDDGIQYKLVKLANDVTYRRLKRVLKDLASYRSGPCSRLIEVLFGETELGPPITTFRDGQSALNTDNLSFFNPTLDESQKEAVSFALSQRELSIVHGPPGTGKTTTVVEIILQAVKQGLKILACAPSNVAVDNLVERVAAARGPRVVRLGHPARLLDSIQRLSLDAVLHRSDEAQVTEGIRQDLDQVLLQLKKSTERGNKHQLRAELRLLRKELREQEATAIGQVLAKANVVAATLTSASNDGPLKHLAADHFDLVIIDECSQAMEVACWLAILHARRIVLAGDHLQLPPTIISHEAAKEGLAFTLMERQLELHGEKAVRMLTMQYRMNADIMTWASDQLYGGKLTAHSSVAQHLLSDLRGVRQTEDTTIPLLLIDTVGCNLWELDVEEGVSKGNEGEVDLCVVHVERLISAGLQPEDIAVIAPYNLQVELLRLKLSPRYPKLEIKSVDGFQGREKEAVIISMVRSNTKREVGFLAEDRRTNVAITRARRHLAVICDSETVGHSKFLQSLVDYMSDKGEVRSAEQYIQEGAVDPSSKRSDSLQAKIDASVSTNAQKLTTQTSKKPQKKKEPKSIHKSQEKPKTIHKSGEIPSTHSKKSQQHDAKDEMEDLKCIMTSFYTNDSAEEYAFPPSLKSRQRFLVHELSESLGLAHISKGEGDERHIVVSKVKTPKPIGHKQDGHSQVRENEIKPNEVETSKGKQTSTSSEVGTEAKTASHLLRCSICQQEVPESNLTLHQLRCRAKHVDQKDAVDTSRVQKESRKPASAKSKKKKATRQETTSPEEDFDALIAEAMRENKRCHVDKCHENAATLGRDCPFCARRFCIKHHMPEVHGCGAAARAHARQVISREGVLYRGSGVPDKKPDPAKRAHLQRRLDKKLGEMTAERKVKTHDKKK